MMPWVCSADPGLGPLYVGDVLAIRMCPFVLQSGFCQHFHLDSVFSFSHIWSEVAALFPALQRDNEEEKYADACLPPQTDCPTLCLFFSNCFILFCILARFLSSSSTFSSFCNSFSLLDSASLK